MTPTPQTVVENPVKQILRHGQSIWYDGLIEIKHFETMIREDGIRGATTNPAIFEKALSHHEYDAEIARLAQTETPEEIWKTLSVRAVQQVSDAFAGVFRDSRGEDGYVSIEVSPLLARDTAGTIEEGRFLWKAVSRPNAMIKVPATKEGLPAIKALTADGINVNVTLIFSLTRYREVMDAYLSGLEERLKAGKPLTGIASVASFFVSRVDTAVDKEIDTRLASASEAEKHVLRSLIGRIGIDNSKAAYREFETVFSGERFRKLESAGAQAQRPLWASTGTKNPAYSDTLYVEALMGPRTVNTVPPPTLDAFRDHGKAGSRLKEGTDEALARMTALGAAGIDLDRITDALEKAGVESFADSYRKIIQSIGAKKS